MKCLSVAEECCTVKRLDEKKINDLLRTGSISDCQKVLAEVLEEIRFNELRSMVLRLYVSTDIYLSARSFSRELGIDNEEFIRCFGGIDDIGIKMASVEGTVGFLHELLVQCVRWRIGKCRENGNCVVKNARDYIDANYMSGELSLTNVADAVGISPAYLSSLFKKETGSNLSEYITRVRIDKSKELLCCTSKLVYEIAFEVGFQDYRYFSQIFKKCTGQTPRQFQNTANLY
ncbi:MAG: helix-turn-helix domain-containing protein [Ruminococcus sp.]|nr:helix-turn-helix domain-containing protein [Ruminococcus sp.]MBQ1432637.1 helix-turn-helix domain-containing protein [Ruminococcus sp.]